MINSEINDGGDPDNNPEEVGQGFPTAPEL